LNKAKKKPISIKEDSANVKRGRKASAICFPRDPLIKVLLIAEAIWKNNAGKSMDILDIAKAVNQSPTSSAFITQLASSYRYGLTESSPTTKKISLTLLGSSIVTPSLDEDVNVNLLGALLNPPIFKAVYTWMDRKPIPREDVFREILTKPSESNGFGILKTDLDEFISVFMQNINDLQLEEDHKGTVYLGLDKISPVVQQSQSVTSEEAGGSRVEAEIALETQTCVARQTKITSLPSVCQETVSTVFISHSKNALILEQLKTMLELGEFKYKIAEEEENTAIPIPEKVFEMMMACNCAIINVSAAESEKKQDGSYGVNENVLTVIGGAFLAHQRKIILLVDRRVKLPSNLQGLYRYEYEGEKLAFSTYIKLEKSLVEFRKP